MERITASMDFIVVEVWSMVLACGRCSCGCVKKVASQKILAVAFIATEGISMKRSTRNLLLRTTSSLVRRERGVTLPRELGIGSIKHDIT